MVKLFVLLLTVLLAVVSAGGYFFLDEKITAGKGQLADGQKEVGQGQPALEKGKAKLEAGRLELAEGKEKYEKAHGNVVLVFMDNLFNRGRGFENSRKQIDEGDRQVAQGEARIIAGEKRLATGEMDQQRGREQLKLARTVRVACALGAIVFGALSIVLAILWRQSLVRIFR